MRHVYTREVREVLGYCATWLPNTVVRIGDVGVLDGNEYRRVANASDFGLDLTIRSGSADALLDYTSADAVDIGVLAGANGPNPLVLGTEARAYLEVGFRKADAVLFQAGPTEIEEIENLQTIGAQVMECYAAGKWRDEYVLVTELVKAERTTVLVSSGANAKALFSADARVALGPASLVNANAGLKLERAEQLGIRVVAESGLTPLFRAFAVRRPELKRKRFGPLRATPFFGEVDYDDFA